MSDIEKWDQAIRECPQLNYTYKANLQMRQDGAETLCDVRASYEVDYAAKTAEIHTSISQSGITTHLLTKYAEQKQYQKEETQEEWVETVLCPQEFAKLFEAEGALRPVNLSAMTPSTAGNGASYVPKENLLTSPCYANAHIQSAAPDTLWLSGLVCQHDNASVSIHNIDMEIQIP